MNENDTFPLQNTGKKHFFLKDLFPYWKNTTYTPEKKKSS